MYTPPEPLKCPQDLFDRLWASRGSYNSQHDVIELAYKAMGEGVVIPLGIYRIYFPDTPPDLLSNWESLEYWLGDIHHALSIENIWTPEFDYLEEGAPAPEAIFSTLNSLKSAVLELAKNDENEKIFESLWGASITDGERTLLLVYSNLDAWVLGHADSIEVFESVDTMNEEDGYYAL